MKTTALALVVLTVGLVHAQQTRTKESPAEHHTAVTDRGDQAMGFSHEKTTHHFRLYKDGGAIKVTANDPKDIENRNMIRMHLSHIAQMFAQGNFNTPMFIHDTTPPGVPTMTKLHDQIDYQVQETESGAKVRIRTANAQALDAIHAFLLFQITDHQTGDSPDISQGPSR